jgi:hypothetical protein
MTRTAESSRPTTKPNNVKLDSKIRLNPASPDQAKLVEGEFVMDMAMCACCEAMAAAAASCPGGPMPPPPPPPM